MLYKADYMYWYSNELYDKKRSPFRSKLIGNTYIEQT